MMARIVMLALVVPCLVCCSRSENISLTTYSFHTLPSLATSGQGEEELSPVDPSSLTITAGHITKYSTTQFSIRDSVMRGELEKKPRKDVAISFVYLGESQKPAPLASGEMRRQIGLKLRSANTCNVVYVMWHIEPNQGIFVAVKSNPEQSRHEQCQDRGYISVRSSRQWKEMVPSIRKNEPHTLRARLDGRMLRVWADNVEVWYGELPDEAFVFDGGVGLRSDNGEFDVEMWAR